MKNQLPEKLKQFIEPANLTPADCLDLLSIASNALQQCYSQDYSEMSFGFACEWSKCLQDSFYSIRESDGFVETGLTPKEWSELAQFAGERYNLLGGEI